MAKQAGSGFRLSPGAVATWINPSNGRRLEFPINFAFEYNEQTAGQTGPTGGASEKGPAFLGRWAGGGTVGMSSQGYYGQGWWDKLFGNNGIALENWYNEQSEAHKAQWDGVPTLQEMYDLALTESRTASSFYRQYLPELTIYDPPPVDTRPLPAIGDPVDVLKAGAWVSDTVKGFTGQAITFAKAGNRLKADRDKTWRVPGAAPVEPTKPTPVDPVKPADPPKPAPARPKIPVGVLLLLNNGHRWTKPGRLKAALETAKAWALTVADE